MKKRFLDGALRPLGPLLRVGRQESSNLPAKAI
jgi:hypothetical protein